MHLSKASCLTLLILVLIITTSYVSLHHDQKRWLEISESFQHAFLPDEINQYTDYLQRKTILEISDEPNTYTAPSLKQLSLVDLSKLILLDRSYKEYIFNEGHLFIDPWTLSVWKESRTQLELEVDKLLLSRLALNQNDVRFSSIISHVLVNRFDTNLYILLCALSMSIFLLLMSMRLPHFLAALLIYLSLESFCFIVLSRSSDPILYGGFGLLACTWALCIRSILTKQINNDFLTGKKLTSFLLLLTLLASIYTVLSLFSHTLSWNHLISATLASLLVVVIIQLNSRIEAKETQIKHSNLPDNKKEYRPELAKALDFISRFEFDNAKQTLNTLAKKYPNSLTILEKRYQLSKFQPELETYQELAQRLIDLSAERNDYRRMLILFKDIQKATKSKQKASNFLLPEHYHKMMRVFIDQNDLDKTEQAFHFLELSASDALKIDACRLLIEKFKALQNTRKQQQYEMLLQRLV